MANTATLSGSASVSSASASGQANDSFAPTLAGTRFADLVQTATTAAAAVNIGSVATLGYIFIKNLDGTNYVQISSDGATFAAGKICAKLKAGEFCILPAEPTATYGCRANTLSCDIQVIAIEA